MQKLYLIYAVLDGEEEYLGCATSLDNLRKMIVEGLHNKIMRFYTDIDDSMIAMIRQFRKCMADQVDIITINSMLHYAEIREFDFNEAIDSAPTLPNTLFDSGALACMCRSKVIKEVKNNKALNRANRAK